jgi:hypothetical protein
MNAPPSVDNIILCFTLRSWIFEQTDTIGPSIGIKKITLFSAYKPYPTREGSPIEDSQVGIERSRIMYTICYEIKDFDEILPELEIVLSRLGDDLIGHELLWI